MSNKATHTNNRKFRVKETKGNSFVSKFTFTKNLSLIIPFILISMLLIIAPLIVIIINIFNPVSGNVADNWAIMTGTIWEKIGKSLWISIVASLICLLLAFPFSYSLSMFKNKIFQSLVLLFVTTPIWINILVKLIGLKSLFDIMNHELNSTYGDIYTIIGLVYLFAPFMIMPIYTALDTLPRNLINASKDLGRSNLYTFFFVVVPWCKVAIASGITLVLLPCFTTVTVPAFLNNSNDGPLIGDLIVNQGDSGLSNPLSLARTSVLVLVVSGITLFVYLSIVYIPKLFFIIKKRIGTRNEK